MTVDFIHSLLYKVRILIAAPEKKLNNVINLNISVLELFTPTNASANCFSTPLRDSSVRLLK